MTQPFCRYFGTCGGCAFQDMDQAAYAVMKHGNVVRALRKLGITHEVASLVDAHGIGRRRVTLHVREKDGQWQAGFMRSRSHDLIAVADCPVLVPQLHAAPAIAALFGPQLGSCDVSITAAENGLDVAVKSSRDVVMRRLQTVQQIVTANRLIRLSVNGEPLFVNQQPIVQMGKASVPLPLNSFLQATQKGEDELVALVGAALRKSRNVIDLFSGAGPFSFRLAETARVHAADMDKPAITALQTAVNSTQGLKPITTEVRDLFRNPFVPQELNEFDGIVIDPPRAGAEAQCRNIAKSKIRRVASVSCDATTFARDISILLGGGYSLKSITPIDQFKWTPHVEIVGILER